MENIITKFNEFNIGDKIFPDLDINNVSIKKQVENNQYWWEQLKRELVPLPQWFTVTGVVMEENGEWRYQLDRHGHWFPQDILELYLAGLHRLLQQVRDVAKQQEQEILRLISNETGDPIEVPISVNPSQSDPLGLEL